MEDNEMGFSKDPCTALSSNSGSLIIREGKGLKSSARKKTYGTSGSQTLRMDHHSAQTVQRA